MGRVDSHQVVWEAYKTVIRGEALSLIAAQKKEKRQELERLEREILQLENENNQSHTSATIHALQLKQDEYRALYSDRARAIGRDTQSRLYDQGDKAGKLIAWLDKKEQASRLVPELCAGDGSIITDPQAIVDRFAEYYREVYQSKSQYTELDSESLLQDIRLPSLTEAHRDALETEITNEEIISAIKALHPGKATGPNGIPIELYKLRPDVLAPHLRAMFLKSRDKRQLPLDQRLATIIVIHKSNKPHTDCASYRPTSLLNAKPKILAKLLAARLVKVIDSLVHPDQSGFMPRRNTALNLRRVHGVLGRAHTIQEEAILVSLDASMAFDRVEWPYLMAVLGKMGIGPNYIEWVRLLYADPLAQVVVNNKKSEPFKLGRVTRQGCPLSPLLFALALEPLAAWVRRDPVIRGLRWTPEWEDRISLYADDILLYLAAPDMSLSRVLDIFDIYGQYSGFTINWHKSLVYVLSAAAPILRTRHPITIAADGVVYLGIFIFLQQNLRFERNLKPPLNRLKQDIDHWRTLPLSYGESGAIQDDGTSTTFVCFTELDGYCPQALFNGDRGITKNIALGGET